MRRFAPFLVVLTIACGDARSPGADPVVENLSAPPARERLDARLVAVSDPEAAFTLILDMAVGGDGRMYVGDLQVKGITVLSPEGSLERVIGRGGGGPGEYEYVKNVHLFRDSLFVFDHGRSRLTVYGPNKKTVAYTRNLTDHSKLSPMGVQPVDQNRLLGMYREAFIVGDEADRRRWKIYRLLDRSGRMIRDSLLTVRDDESLVATTWGSISVRDHPFGTDTHVALTSENELMVGWTGEPVVRVYSLKGELIDRIPVPHRRAEVTAADLDSVRSEIPDRYHEVLTETAPAHWPAFRQMLLDDQDRLWIGTYGQGGRATSWSVYDREGNRVAAVGFDRDIELEVVRDGRAYGIVVDSLDVPRVNVYDLVERAVSAEEE